MKKDYIIIILCLVCTLPLPAQTIKGKVADVNGRVLQGVTIKVNDQGVTTTDQKGAFSVNCEPGATVAVSSVGYESQLQTIQDCNSELSFQLVESTQMLAGVEITATSNQNKMMLNLPSSIAKLGELEIKRGVGLFLDDAINANVPGVFMQRRSVSGGQQFNIRGYGAGGPGVRGASSNFDGQGVKVYLNGIPITDAEGITVMDDIDFGSVGNVEIVKGPSGTLYGLAVAGVINLQTVKPVANKISLSQNTMMGSYGLRRSTTSLQVSQGSTSLLINYGSQNYDGFMQHTQSRKDFVNMMGEFHLNDKQSITSYVGWSDSYDQRNGELSKAQYDALDYSGNPAYIKNDAHSSIVSFRAGLGHTYKFNENISNATIFFGTGAGNNASSAGGWTDKTPVNFGVRSVFDAKFKWAENISLSGVTGVEAQRQYAQTIGYAMVTDNANPTGYNIIGAMRSNQTSVTSTYSIFTQWTLALPYNFAFTTGIGSSSMNITLYDRFYVAANNTPANTTPTTYVTDYKNLVSPSFALNKMLTKNLSAHISYNKGYKAPVASDIYTPLAGTVNTSLRPEIGKQIEVGSKGNLLDGKLYFEVAYFATKFSDKMTSVAVPNAGNTATAYTYTVNSGSLDNRGLEVLVKYMVYHSETGFIRSLRPFANFTYSDFRYENFTYQGSSGTNPVGSPTDYTGKAVAGVPKNVWNAGLDLASRSGLYLNATYMHRDAMPITSDGSLMTNAYELLNSKIGYRKSLGQHVDVDASFGANNITGKQYYQMVFINQQPDTYLPGPTRINFFGGLNLKYIF
ncbi:MAG TPA: TonB-dependent receptor [Cyclobacteriaceae bacterium]|nr:TonB-dependent receptor [Cyclobacteriaceae bacterium]